MNSGSEKLRQDLINAYENDMEREFELPDSGENNIIKDFATRIEKITGEEKPHFHSLYNFLDGSLKKGPRDKNKTAYQKYIDIVNSQKISHPASVTIQVSDYVKPFLNALSALIKARDYISVSDVYSKGIQAAKEREDIYGKTLLKIWYSKVLEFTDPPQAEKLVKESLKILKSSPLDTYEFELKERLCLVQLRQHDIISAEFSTKELFKLAGAQHDQLYIAKAHFLFSRIAFFKSNFSQSLSNANACIRYAKKLLSEDPNPIEAARTLANGYYAKSQVYLASGEYVLARLNLRNAIQEFSMHGVDDIVFAHCMLSLAELDLYLTVNTLPTLTAYLHDAMRIYATYTNWNDYLRCVTLGVEIALIQGNLKFAQHVLDSAKAILPAEQNGEHYGTLLSITSGYYLRITDYGKAEETLDQLYTLANDHSMHHLLILYYSGKSVLEAAKSNNDGQKEYLMLAANVLEKQIRLNEPPKSEFRYLYAELLRLSGHSISESIANYEQVAQEYKAKGLNEPYALLLVKTGVGYCEQGNSDKAQETLLLANEASKKPLSPETTIAVREACAVYFFQIREFTTAKRYFDEAIGLSRKKVIKPSETLTRLRYLFEVKESLDHPTFESFNATSTIQNLYNVINNIEEEAERRKFIRFWFYSKFPNLYASIYHSHGLKGAILTDDVHMVTLVSGKLCWLFDFFFVYSNEPTNDSILIDSFTIPNHTNNDSLSKLKGIGQVTATLYPNQYAAIEDDTKFHVSGICQALPAIVYDCVENKVVSPAVCVVPITDAKEIKRNYLGIHSWLDLGSIPIYVNEDCPYPVLRTISINMVCHCELDRNTLSEAKRLINSLWKISETPSQASLNTFKLDWDGLIEGLEYETIPARISIVEIDLGLKKQITPSLILTID